MKPPAHVILLLPLIASSCLLGACVFSADGSVHPAAPKAIQGNNDVRGDPIMVPGAGMGVGAGNPRGPTSGTAAPPR
jgi:hypothetical protein